MVQQIASMENRTVNDCGDISKLLYDKQILRKAMSCKSPYELSHAEKDNLFSLFAEYGLRQICTSIFAKVDAKIKSSYESMNKIVGNQI